MKKIVIFQVEKPIQVKVALATMKLRIEAIPIDKYNQTIACLVNGITEDVPAYTGKPLNGSLLLMCGLNNREMDQVLQRLRQQKIDVTYKAVLTETNQTWTVTQFYAEMEKEKAFYEQNAKG